MDWVDLEFGDYAYDYRGIYTDDGSFYNWDDLEGFYYEDSLRD